MAAASVRFYGSLNDFLPRAERQATLVCGFDGTPSVKDFVEALGVPHPEIDLLVVAGCPVEFAYRVHDGDRIAVYPRMRRLDPGDGVRLGPPPQPEPRFVADVHLGRLAAYLRLAGFDTKYRNDYSDDELVATSSSEDRTLLTRDVGALKHRIVTRGYFLREVEPARQLVEVLRHFDLVAMASPFSRCMRCNVPLTPVIKERIEHLLPERTREHYLDFSRCPGCGRIYWQGSHHSRMKLFIESALDAAARPRRS